ncbi:Lyso-phosphatidylcholine acyltransferase [Savitreella phatthalungensis]
MTAVARSKDGLLLKGSLPWSNHTSVVDDPLIWGLMPWRTLIDPTMVRWSLGSADICFTNRVLSTFFSLGQTIPTYRHGVGIFQDGIDDAIRLLAYRQAWLHVFPEGRIRQSKDLSMRYFKWGVARIILESSAISEQPPLVVPMFIEGLQDVMSDRRTFPTFLPRLWKQVHCTYGPPIADELILPFIERWQALVQRSNLPDNAQQGFHKRHDAMIDLADTEEARNIRIELTEVLRTAVADLRLSRGYPAEHPDAHRAEFYNSAEGSMYDLLGNVPRPAIFDRYKEENLRRKKAAKEARLSCSAKRNDKVIEQEVTD